MSIEISNLCDTWIIQGNTKQQSSTVIWPHPQLVHLWFFAGFPRWALGCLLGTTIPLDRHHTWHLGGPVLDVIGHLLVGRNGRAIHGTTGGLHMELHPVYTSKKKLVYHRLPTKHDKVFVFRGQESRNLRSVPAANWHPGLSKSYTNKNE